MEPWIPFVLERGWRVPAYELAHILARGEDEIRAARATGAVRSRSERVPYVELFAAWHGRAPGEADWPPPRRIGGGYAWDAPALALIATLVGQMAPADIAAVLTARLREQTGDPSAERTVNAVQTQINRLEMQASQDVVGGITPAQAGREIGAPHVVYQAIERGDLQTQHAGRNLVIPHAEWARWKAIRDVVPEGYVKLASIKGPLGIRSDKLSEYARDGLVPGAIQCALYGRRERQSRQGCWYIHEDQARQLVRDRRAGRPMPWHGKPNLHNLRKTYALWLERKHPEQCETCQAIWGSGAAPQDFEDYLKRYPPLAHGAKRHLTMDWNPGLKVAELAARTGRSESDVRRAIDSGALLATVDYGGVYISRSEAARWEARGCPNGSGKQSWVSIDVAVGQYGFSERELRALAEDGKLAMKVGTDGAQRGITYVAKHQCAQLRARLGFTEAQAARRVGVTIPRLRSLLKGVDWRGTAAIPLDTVNAVIKRLQSQSGRTFEEAAEDLCMPVDWVVQQHQLGTIKVSRVAWDQRRTYISDPMFERLRQARDAGDPPSSTPEGLGIADAALDAGVSQATVQKWGNSDEIARHPTPRGWRYERRSLRTRARRYWTCEVRNHRAVPPPWMSTGETDA